MTAYFDRQVVSDGGIPVNLDTQLLHALQLDGRASFSVIAEVLGVSDQTIARRYNRLHEAGTLRVRGLVDPERLHQTSWLVRVQCTPGAAAATAAALARRRDTAWISLNAGGTEIVCAVQTGGEPDRDSLLLEAIPRSRTVVAMTAQCVLHIFFGNSLSIINKTTSLSEAQVQRLRFVETSRGVSAPLNEGDKRLLVELEQDGRATFAHLAVVTGWSQTTVRRRVAELRADGTLYFDVDFEQALLGLPIRAALWLSIAPDRLDEAGRALSTHPETAYVAATTGKTNLYAGVLIPGTAALYEYLTTSIAGLPGLQRVETAPVLRTVKHSGLLGRP